MSEQVRILQLLEEALSSGRTPEDVCAGSPDLLVAVRARWEHCRRLDARLANLFPSALATCTNADTTFAVDAAGTRLHSELPSIPGYAIETVLGRGGVGIVYGARHLLLRRPVALKMLLAGAYAGRVERARFQREAQAVAALRHPHVVQVHDVGEHDGRPYFTMELMEGGSLADRLGGVPQPSGQAVLMLIAIAGAVHKAHLAGIIHRDLKPANVLLATDGTAKVSDFGLALHTGTEDGEGFGLTLSGARLGTPSYMAPEQAAGRRSAVGPASDIYSLGAILYEMLTGRPPFRGETAAETERQVIAEEPVPPSRLNTRVPHDLETICLTCLQKEAHRRYPSAELLAEDLQRFQNHEPIHARRTIWIERAAKWVRRRPAFATSIFATAIIVVAFVGGSLWMVSQRAAINKAVAEDLQDAARNQQLSSWAQANSALDRASLRLGTHGPVSLRERLERGRRDSKLAVRLDQIRDQVGASSGGLFNMAQIDHDCVSAFQEGGLDAEKDDPQDFSEKLRSSNIQTRIIAALDDWSGWDVTVKRRNWIADIVRRADRDPVGFRDSVRNPATWNDGRALARIVRAAPVATIASQPATFLMAVAAQLKRKRQDGDRLLLTTQQTHPDHFYVNLQMGMRMAELGKTSAEVGYFQVAVALRPDLAVAHNNLGVALMATGRLDEAIVEYRQTIRRDPTCVAVHKSLGDLLLRTGKREDGIAELKEAIRNHPKEEEYLSLGDIYAQADQYAEALACVQRAMELQPTGEALEVAKKSQYVLLMRVGRLEEALSGWQKDLQSHPDDRNVWFGYAQYCLFAGRVAEYRQARQAILAKFGSSDDPRVCEVMARAGLLMETSEEELRQATAMVDRALAADPAKYGTFSRHFKFAKGLAEYRAGRFESAASIMALDAAPVLGPAPKLVGAMAQYHLGKIDESRQTLNQAVRSFDWGGGYARISEVWMFHVLRREAEAMINPMPG